MRTLALTRRNGNESAMGRSGMATVMPATCSRYQLSADATATPLEPRNTTRSPRLSTSKTSSPASGAICSTTKCAAWPGTTRWMSEDAALTTSGDGGEVGAATAGDAVSAASSSRSERVRIVSNATLASVGMKCAGWCGRSSGLCGRRRLGGCDYRLVGPRRPGFHAGIIRRMKSSNIGTVNAVSPCAGL